MGNFIFIPDMFWNQCK